MVALTSIVKNTPGKSTTYLGADGQQYTLSGDLSQRANNPGNLSPMTKSARQYYEQNFNVIGYVKSSNGPDVAVFATPQDGARAQQALWASPKYQNMTIEQAAKSWAASPYVDQLAKAAGVDKSTKVSDLNPTQMQSMFQVQTGIEGSRNLSITGADGAAIPRQNFFPETATNPALAAINSATGSAPAPAPMPGRPAALSGPQAAAPLRLPSGNTIAPGVYQSSNPGHQVQVSPGPNGTATITHIQNPGEIPGVVDPLHESPGTIVGGIVSRTVQDMASKGAASAIQSAAPVVQGAANTATTAVGNAAAALPGQAQGALNYLGSLFGGGQTSTPGPSSPSPGALSAPSAPTNALASSVPGGARGVPTSLTSMGQLSNYVGAGGTLGPTTTYTPQQMQASNPDYLKYVAAQKADPVGAGPGTLADLNALASSGTPPPSSAPAAPPRPSGPVYSAAAQQAQQLLTAHGYKTEADGLYGPATASSVRAFQAANGLKADGIIGPQTLSKLTAAPVRPAAPVAPVNVMAKPPGVAAVANSNYYATATGDAGSAHSGSGGGASNGYLFN